MSVRSLVAFPLSVRRKILFDPESQSNAARRATTVAEKNKIETGQPDERRYRAFIAIEWARTVSVRRFPVFPAAASRAVEKCASLLLASWMTGWRDPGGEEPRRRKRERRDERRRGKKEKRKKGEKAEKEEEIVHLSSCKVGKMDGTRNFPSRGSALRSGATYSF